MPQPLPSQSINPQYLQEGAVYALEQGRLLLHDSVLLYRNRKYASAIVLALFAREEVGRYKLLRDLRKEMVEKGCTVTVEDIRRECKNHVEKQFQSQSGVTLKTSGDDQLAKILRTRFDYHPQSQEFQEATAQLDTIVKKVTRIGPHQRHDLRQKSLYVEPSDSGTSWNRPQNQSQQTAKEEIEGAANAYLSALDRFTSVGAYRDEDPTFYSALELWKECPAMPTISSSDLPGFD